MQPLDGELDSYLTYRWGGRRAWKMQPLGGSAMKMYPFDGKLGRCTLSMGG